MNTRIVRSLYAVLPLVVLVAAACGPSDLVGKTKLSAVHTGMKQAEVVAIMGTGPLKPHQVADSLRVVNGFRTQAFIVAGQTYRVLWYREAPGSLEDAITREKETPILMKSDTVVSVGWNDFDEAAEKLNIPNPYRASARIDSISKSQNVKAK